MMYGGAAMQAQAFDRAIYGTWFSSYTRDEATAHLAGQLNPARQADACGQ